MNSATPIRARISAVFCGLLGTTLFGGSVGEAGYAVYAHGGDAVVVAVVLVIPAIIGFAFLWAANDLFHARRTGAQRAIRVLSTLTGLVSAGFAARSVHEITAGSFELTQVWTFLAVVAVLFTIMAVVQLGVSALETAS